MRRSPWGRAAAGRPGRRRSAVALLTVVLAVAALAAACTNPPGTVPSTPPTTTAPLPGPPGRFSVLSYNVAGLPQEISEVSPSTNIPLISPLLDAYDVVLTQEDFDWWQPIAWLLDFANYHQRLRAQAHHPYRSGQHPGPLAVGLDLAPPRTLLIGDGLGLLSRFPFTELDRVPWRGCFGGIVPDGGAADCLAMKGFARTTMTLADGHLVDVYDLHGEAGNTPQDQELQAAGFEQLADYVLAHSAGRAVVLGGDTNLHTDSTHPDSSGGADSVIWQRFLDRTGLTDTCTELGCADTGSIDKIAYRDGTGVDLQPVDHDFPVARFQGPSGDLSDHPPLVVTFEWSAPAY